MTFPVPDNPDALQIRKATALALQEVGYPVSEATLATMATRGGGPPFHKFGPRPLYRWGDALDWARARLSPLMHSTSEIDAARLPVRKAPTPRAGRARSAHLDPAAVEPASQAAAPREGDT
jgi:hypothetical protein